MKFFKSQPLSTNVDTDKASTTKVPIVKAVFDWVSGLFVKGAVSSTDNAIARFDGTTGKVLQNSAVTISDTGNIGINTSSPALMIEASVNTNGSDGVYIRNSSTGTSANSFLSVVSSAGSATYRTYSTAHTVWPSKTILSTDSGVSNGLALLTANPSAPIELWTASTQRMVVNSAGNVGINTPSPSARLDINGQSRFRDTATFNGQIIDNSGSTGTDGQVLKKVGSLVVWSNP